MGRRSGCPSGGGVGLSAPDDLTSEQPVQAFITQLTGASSGASPFVSLLVRSGGKEIRLQIETDAGLIERTALPEAMRKELAWVIDALEVVSQPETPIAVRLDTLGSAE
jgi:hypothetical protein